MNFISWKKVTPIILSAMMASLVNAQDDYSEIDKLANMVDVTVDGYTIDTCYPEAGIDYVYTTPNAKDFINMCSKHNVGMYKKLVKEKKINYAGKYIFSRLSFSGDRYRYVAIDPKKKAVYVYPFVINTEDNQMPKWKFDNKSSNLCLIGPDGAEIVRQYSETLWEGDEFCVSMVKNPDSKLGQTLGFE